MKYVELKKFTAEKGAMPIYLFEGEDAFFRERAEELLTSKYLRDKTLDFASFDGASLKGEKLKPLIDAVNCFPFLSEKRFVKVTEFYPSEKEYEFYLKALFENPPKDGVLMIFNAGKGKAGSAALAKKPNVTFVDCGKSDEETVKKWICLTFKRAGVYVDGVTAGKLADFCGLDMSRISKETEKLILYLDAKGLDRLTDEIVEETVYPDSSYKLYELGNALSRKNYTAFMRILNELSLKGYDEMSLLNSLAFHFKGLYEASISRGSDAQVAAALGMKEYAVRKNREQAARFEKGALLACYRQAYAAISGVKCGELTLPSALDKFVAEIFFAK